MVFFISLGQVYQADIRSLVEVAKYRFEFPVTDNGLKLFPVIVDFLPDLLYNIGPGHPEAAAGKTFSRFQVKIIARQSRLATACLDAGAEIGFVGRFIFREPYVAVDAEQAVAR